MLPAGDRILIVMSTTGDKPKATRTTRGTRAARKPKATTQKVTAKPVPKAPAKQAQARPRPHTPGEYNEPDLYRERKREFPTHSSHNEGNTHNTHEDSGRNVGADKRTKLRQEAREMLAQTAKFLKNPFSDR